MTLICHWEILASMIHDGHVGIPLDVSNLRILGQQIVNHTINKVLYLRIGQIENQLRTATSQYCITLRSLDNPVWMFLIKFTYRIGHFRFNPNTKFHAVFLGITKQTLYAIRQFFGINHPVAKCTVVCLTRIFLAKPSVIHHKEFTSHAMYVGHHLVHPLLIDIEINALPGVQKDVTLLVTMSEDILTSPFMEIATCATQTFCRISQSESWSLESLTFLQMILRILLIDTGKEVVKFRIVGNRFQLIVAAIYKRCANDITRILLSLAIE